MNFTNNRIMKNKSSFRRILIGIVVGIFVGFLSGFFGGGGGMLVVPLLMFVFGFEEKKAHATAIFTILPISFAGAIVYISNGKLGFENVTLTSIGFVLGGLLGAFLLKKSNNRFLRILFGLIVIVAGIKVLF